MAPSPLYTTRAKIQPIRPIQRCVIKSETSTQPNRRIMTDLPTQTEPKIVRANLDLVLDWIADGRSIDWVAQQLGVSRSAVSALQRRNSDVCAQMRTARAMSAHRRVQEAVDIADELAENPDVDPSKAAHERIEIRKWVAERHAPEIYGDKAHKAPASGPTVNVNADSMHLSAVKAANGGADEPIEGEFTEQSDD